MHSTYMYVRMYVYIHIYAYTESEREGKRERGQEVLKPTPGDLFMCFSLYSRSTCITFSGPLVYSRATMAG